MNGLADATRPAGDVEPVVEVLPPEKRPLTGERRRFNGEGKTMEVEEPLGHGVDYIRREKIEEPVEPMSERMVIRIYLYLAFGVLGAISNIDHIMNMPDSAWKGKCQKDAARAVYDRVTRDPGAGRVESVFDPETGTYQIKLRERIYDILFDDGDPVLVPEDKDPTKCIVPDKDPDTPLIANTCPPALSTDPGKWQWF